MTNVKWPNQVRIYLLAAIFIILLPEAVKSQVGISVFPLTSGREVGFVSSQSDRIVAEFRFDFDYRHSGLGAGQVERSWQFRPELLGYYRIINDDDFKLYAGLGANAYFTWNNERDSVELNRYLGMLPVGIEFFPAQRGRLSLLSFGFELSPAIQFWTPTNYSVKFRPMIRVTYYIAEVR